MSNIVFRAGLPLIVTLSALSAACASDQRTANTPDDGTPPAQAPAESLAPEPAGDAAPNGQPVSTPPSNPEPGPTPEGGGDQAH